MKQALRRMHFILFDSIRSRSGELSRFPVFIAVGPSAGELAGSESFVYVLSVLSTRSAIFDASSNVFTVYFITFKRIWCFRPSTNLSNVSPSSTSGMVRTMLRKLERYVETELVCFSLRNFYLDFLTFSRNELLRNIALKRDPCGRHCVALSSCKPPHGCRSREKG